MPEHESPERQGQRDEACCRNSILCIHPGDAIRWIVPRGEPTSRERRCHVREDRHEMRSSQEIDQDRRRRAADTEKHDSSAERFQVARQSPSEGAPRSKREDEPSKQEGHWKWKERQCTADNQPSEHAEQRSNRESSRQRGKPESHELTAGTVARSGRNYTVVLMTSDDLGG